MSIFDVISLFGGLAMFLYGMRLMGDSLKENSSGTLKTIMERVTDNSIKAFLLGIAVTALIQSSTATIVITSGLVAAGILSLHQSLGIIIGANVGTTVTGQIIRLLDLNSNGFLRFFQPSTLAPIALVIGIVLIMTHIRSAGNIAIGFGILFSGLLNMTSAVRALQESGLIEGLLSGLGDNPVVGYLTGAGIAFALQSSSATVGILQAFSATGLLSFKAIYSVIVGIYLGDCVTTAIVCSIGANREAKRVGIVNILFNLSETVLVLIVVTVLHKVGLLDALWDRTVNSGMIANTNTIFNLVCAVTLLPVVGVYEKMSGKIVREGKKPESRYDAVIEGLSPAFFSSPALALGSCYETLMTMLKVSRGNLEKAQELLKDYQGVRREEILADEREIDRLTDKLSRYMVELFPNLLNEKQVAILNQYYRVSVELERLGDHAVNIADIAMKLSEEKTVFSETFMRELAVLQSLIDDVLDDCEEAFKNRNVEAASLIEPKVRVVMELVNKLVSNHFNRMSAGECSLLADSAFTNLMGEYKRIGAICSNVGIATMVRVRPELADHEHLFFETLDQSGDSLYNQVFEETYKQYFDLLAL